MMNVIIVTVGSFGDIYPFIGVGRALKNRGHSVTVLANSYFEKTVGQNGLDFVSIGSVDEYFDMMERSNDPNWTRFSCDYLAIRPIEPVYEYLANLNNKQHTITVCNPSGFGARMAHDKFGLPMISITLVPTMFPSAYDPPQIRTIKSYPGWVPRWIYRALIYISLHFIYDHYLLSPVNQFRKKIGLEPLKNNAFNWSRSPQKIIGLFPDWFAKPQPDWPAQVELAGFPLFDEGAVSENKISAELEEFLSAGDAPIIFTPGTPKKNFTSFFQNAMEATIRLGARAIFVSLYEEQIPRNLPPAIKYFKYLPFSQLFPRASVLVYHGGIGTLSQALNAGRPQLVTPWGIDQFDSALRIRRLGVGDAVNYTDCTVDLLVEKLDLLMNSREIQARCAEISGKIKNSDPLNDICRIIEETGATAR
jgi:rhamnosyltransferase subunit B